jgi:hypothetical protein
MASRSPAKVNAVITVEAPLHMNEILQLKCYPGQGPQRIPRTPMAGAGKARDRGRSSSEGPARAGVAGAGGAGAAK